jgi:hypothetical protein
LKFNGWHDDVGRRKKIGCPEMKGIADADNGLSCPFFQPTTRSIVNKSTGEF